MKLENKITFGALTIGTFTAIGLALDGNREYIPYVEAATMTTVAVGEIMRSYHLLKKYCLDYDYSNFKSNKK